MTRASHAPPTSSDSRSIGDDRAADRLLVIGVGNRDRGDDGVGPAVCDLIALHTGTATRTLVVEGDVADLPLRWEPSDRVTIVDATPPADHPGRVTVVDALEHRLTPPRAVSTHGIDVAAAVELARVLGRLPAQLVVIGIEAAHAEHGAGLSDEVAHTARSVAGRLAADRPF